MRRISEFRHRGHSMPLRMEKVLSMEYRAVRKVLSGTAADATLTPEDLYKCV